jgi:hypothetical protein
VQNVAWQSQYNFIGDSEKMCSKSCNNCPSLFLCHTCSYTIYTLHVLCNILIVSVMNPGHVNYLHYAVYCYNCVGFVQCFFFLLIALGRRGLSVKKLLFVVMIIISVRLSMKNLGHYVISVLRSLGTFWSSYHSSGSIPGQVIWDLWWTVWHWERFSLSASVPPPHILNHRIIETVESQHWQWH